MIQNAVLAQLTASASWGRNFVPVLFLIAESVRNLPKIRNVTALRSPQAIKILGLESCANKDILVHESATV